MTNIKSTKKALVVSVVSILVCFSMLIGTTFAWFTDSVTSSGNIIKTGNLDVEMYWADGTEDPDSANWIDASTGAIFNYEYWEPGYVEVRHIKIENKGSLALKYQVNIVANGEVTDLADVIDVYYVDPAAQVAGRADLTAAMRIGTLTEVLADLGATGAGSLEANTLDTITIALKMQETAGNDYEDNAIGTNFSIQLLATQYTYESDAFGNDYDSDAEMPVVVNNATELATALTEGGIVTLAADVDLGASNITIPEGVTATLDLNGNTLSADQYAFRVGYYSSTAVATSLTLKNGTLEAGSMAIISSGKNSAPNVVVLDNMVVEAGSVGVYHNGSWYGIDVTVKDSTIECGDVGIFLSGSASWNSLNKLNIVNSTVIGSTAVEAKHTAISVTDCTLTATDEEATRNSTSGNCTIGFSIALTNNTTSGSVENTTGSIMLYGTNNLTGRIWVKAEGAVDVTTNVSAQVAVPAAYEWVNGVLTARS